MDFEILTTLNDQADVFYFIDAALVLLWTTSVGCVCLRAPEARMQLDVRLDCFLRRSCDPGKTMKKTLLRYTATKWSPARPHQPLV